MKNRKSYLKLLFLTLVLALVILFLTGTSEDVRWGGGYWEQWIGNHMVIAPALAHQLVFWFRKMIHFVGYGMLGLLFWYYFFIWGLRRAMWPGIGAALLVAVYDEYLQSLTSFRSGKPGDVLLDLCGSLAVCSLYWLLRIKRRGE